MHSKLLTDELWTEIQPLLPRPKRRRRLHPGRKPIDDRRVLTGILFVLKTGIPWDDVPAALGLGSTKTMKRRLQVWTRRGVWSELLAVMHAKLNAAGQARLVSGIGRQLHKKLKIAVRRERNLRFHHGLVVLGCALICWSMLKWRLL